MKKCYVTGKEITADEAVRGQVIICQMDAVTDGEFSTMVTEKYNLIRCSGEDSMFLDELDIKNSKGLLEDYLEGTVVLCPEKVLEAVNDYIQHGINFDIYN